MALKIRLRRMGRKKAPHYRIVVAESLMPRDGRFVATVGHYNPTTKPEVLEVDTAKVQEWLGKGAVPTDTVRSLLRKAAARQPDEANAVTEAVSGAASAVKETVSNAAEAVREAAGDVAERVTGSDAEESAEK